MTNPSFWSWVLISATVVFVLLSLYLDLQEDAKKQEKENHE